MLIAFLAALAVTTVATHVVRRWALRRGFVDHPGGHKQHAAPVALGGGIAIFLGISLPTLAAAVVAWVMYSSDGGAGLSADLQPHLSGFVHKLPILLGVLAGGFALHVVGLYDDRRPLGPKTKLLAQVLVAAFVVVVLRIRAVELLPAPLSILLTILWIVLVTNAFNFLDNVDGLSAGVGAISATIFSLAALTAGQVFVPALGFVLAGALAGYLVFNFPPASIFMGDAGSLVIGYFMGVLTVLTTFHDPAQGLSPLGIFVPLVALAVPLYDVLSVVVHRLRLGTSPFRGDRRHFSHRLIRRGMDTRGAVLTIYLATAATGLPALLLPRVNWLHACLLLLQTGCVVLIIAILEHAGLAPETDAPPKRSPRAIGNPPIATTDKPT